MTEPAKVLRLLEDLEVSMASLYDWFSQLFADNREALKFFVKMNHDELAHRDLVRFQRNLVSRSRGKFDQMDVDVAELQEAQSNIHRFRVTHEQPSLAEAVAFALECEKGLAEQHYRTAMAESNPGIALLVENMARADHRHFDAIKSFADRLGITISTELESVDVSF